MIYDKLVPVQVCIHMSRLIFLIEFIESLFYLGKMARYNTYYLLSVYSVSIASVQSLVL